MRRHALVLTVVLAAFLGACSEQPPEVSANDQVPAAQRIAEASEGAEGEGGEAAGGEASAEEADVIWVSEGIAFTDAPDTMPADGAVMGLEVIGALPHNVIFEGFQGDQVLVEGPGEGFFAAERAIPAGTYTYYCGIVGHREAGMEGEITVE